MGIIINHDILTDTYILAADPSSQSRILLISVAEQTPRSLLEGERIGMQLGRKTVYFDKSGLFQLLNSQLEKPLPIEQVEQVFKKSLKKANWNRPWFTKETYTTSFSKVNRYFLENAKKLGTEEPSSKGFWGRLFSCFSKSKENPSPTVGEVIGEAQAAPKAKVSRAIGSMNDRFKETLAQGEPLLAPKGPAENSDPSRSNSLRKKREGLEATESLLGRIDEQLPQAIDNLNLAQKQLETSTQENRTSLESAVSIAANKFSELLRRKIEKKQEIFEQFKGSKNPQKIISLIQETRNIELSVETTLSTELQQKLRSIQLKLIQYRLDLQKELIKTYKDSESDESIKLQISIIEDKLYLITIETGNLTKNGELEEDKEIEIFSKRLRLIKKLHPLIEQQIFSENDRDQKKTLIAKKQTLELKIGSLQRFLDGDNEITPIDKKYNEFLRVLDSLKTRRDELQRERTDPLQWNRKKLETGISLLEQQELKLSLEILELSFPLENPDYASQVESLFTQLQQEKLTLLPNLSQAQDQLAAVGKDKTKKAELERTVAELTQKKNILEAKEQKLLPFLPETNEAQQKAEDSFSQTVPNSRPDSHTSVQTDETVDLSLQKQPEVTPFTLKRAEQKQRIEKQSQIRKANTEQRTAAKAELKRKIASGELQLSKDSLLGKSIELKENAFNELPPEMQREYIIHERKVEARKKLNEDLKARNLALEPEISPNLPWIRQANAYLEILARIVNENS